MNKQRHAQTGRCYLTINDYSMSHWLWMIRYPRLCVEVLDMFTIVLAILCKMLDASKINCSSQICINCHKPLLIPVLCKSPVGLESTMCACMQSHVYEGFVCGRVRGPQGQGRYQGWAGRCVLPLLSALGCRSLVWCPLTDCSHAKDHTENTHFFSASQSPQSRTEQSQLNNVSVLKPSVDEQTPGKSDNNLADFFFFHPKTSLNCLDKTSHLIVKMFAWHLSKKNINTVFGRFTFNFI